MGKALDEIGWGGALKFGLLTIAMVGYRVMLVPQLRAAYLRLLGAKVGRNTVIHDCRFFNYYRTGFGGLTIGDDCFIGDETLIDLADRVTLESQVTLAERVTVLTHLNVGYQDHPLQKAFPSSHAPVVFKKGAFAGACTTFLSGVTVGEAAFVAAGALVNEDVPPRVLAGGVPAHVIKKLD
ncbi:MAG: acyltransferase [Elusimicrobia bacterium]|nr:acyltransferase [Elusimicrobiota bacterium]